MKDTYYDILHVKKDCSQSDIRNAFRRLIKQYHPDKATDSDILYVQMLNKAYDVLKNPAKRSLYDNELNIKQRSKCKTYEEFKEEAKAFYDEQKNNSEQKDPEHIMKVLKELRKTTEEPLTENDFKNRVDTLTTIREQEYIETMPQKLINDINFDLEKFNDIVNDTTKEEKLDGLIEVEPFNDNKYFDEKYEKDEKNRFFEDQFKNILMNHKLSKKMNEKEQLTADEAQFKYNKMMEQRKYDNDVFNNTHHS